MDSKQIEYPFPLPKITIRLSTPEERKKKFPPLVFGKPRVRVPKYVVVGEADNICSVFGLPQGGDTRADAVFWAERFASKNDYRYVRPKGWEKIEGKLKS